MLYLQKKVHKDIKNKILWDGLCYSSRLRDVKNMFFWQSCFLMFSKQFFGGHSQHVFMI